MSRKTWLIGVFLFCSSVYSYSQETENKRNSFIETEYMIGKIIPNQLIDDFPETDPQQTLVLAFGGTSLDTNSWRKYYNFPETGLMFVYSNFGNNEIFGHNFSAIPFVTLNVFNKFPGKSKLKLGAGVAYFNTLYDSINNPINEVIGSHFTWDIKVFLYHQLFEGAKFSLKAGIGFSHESNGHTGLPNLGMNSALFSLSGQFYTKKEPNFEFPARRKGAYHTPKTRFYNVQQGFGFHEQDATEGPAIGRKLPVYSTSFAYGIIFNNHLKLRTGLVYRFYEQYNTHLKENDDDDLNENRLWSSSNVILFVGNEFLMSHVGIDVRFGVNLHKPFYRKYNPESDIGTTLRKIFSSRIGLNLYLKNTNKNPKHNLFLGAHINANMAKADFTEFSIGYTFCINNK